jgi:preprotein translocase subunit SecG
MSALLVTIHIIVCFFLIIVVLLQSGKAADLAGAFGGMGSQTAFGPRGAATMLSKATTVAAIVFMLTSITLSIIATRRGGVSGSVLDKAPAASRQAPAKGGPVNLPMQHGQPIDVNIPPAPPAGGAAPSQTQGQAPAAPAHAPAHSEAGHNAPPAKK